MALNRQGRKHINIQVAILTSHSQKLIFITYSMIAAFRSWTIGPEYPLAKILSDRLIIESVSAAST